MRRSLAKCNGSPRNACQRLGIPRITHHDLRHLLATTCIESGVDIPTVARWLAHQDGGALAMKVYGHLRNEHSTNMAKKVSFRAMPTDPEATSSLATNGVFSICGADDFVLDGGRWRLAETTDRQPVARIDPPATPMFQQVVAYLERKPAPRGGSFRRDEESCAAVAVCVRWGSEKAIIRQAQGGVHAGLKAVDMLKYGEAWPPSAERVLPFLHPLIGPSRWSHTEQSRAVELPLRRGAQQNS